MECPRCSGFAHSGHIPFYRIKTTHCIICGYYNEDGMEANRRYHQAWSPEDTSDAGGKLKKFSGKRSGR